MSHDEAVTTVQQGGAGGTPAQVVPPGVVVRHSGGSFETIPDPGVANRVLTSNSTGDASWQSVAFSGIVPPGALPGQTPFVKTDGTFGVETPNTFIDPMRPPYNGIADGTYHALSERYTTLAAAQVDYPLATALTEQIDHHALRKADADGAAQGGAIIHIGTREWVTQKRIPWSSYNHLVGGGWVRNSTQGTDKGAVVKTSSVGSLAGPSRAATTVSGNTTITGITDFTDMAEQVTVTGTGIPIACRIVSMNVGAGSIVVSTAPTASATISDFRPGHAMFDVTGSLNFGFHRVGFNYAGAAYVSPFSAMAISDFTGGGTTPSGLGTIDDCYFNNFGGTAIGMCGNVNWITRNRCDGLYGHFICQANTGGGGNVGTDCYIAFNGTGYTYANAGGSTAYVGAPTTGCQGSGFMSDGASRGTGYHVVIANDFYNCRNGIHFYNSPGNRAVGNRCEKNDDAGIHLEGNLTFDNTISANFTYNNGFRPTSIKAGITVRAGATRCNVIGNYSGNLTSADTGYTFHADTHSSTTLDNVDAGAFNLLEVGQQIVTANGVNTPVPRSGCYISALDSNARTITLSSGAIATTTGAVLGLMPQKSGYLASGTSGVQFVGNYAWNNWANGFTMNNITTSRFSANVSSVSGQIGFYVEGPTAADTVGVVVSETLIIDASQQQDNINDGFFHGGGTNTMIRGLYVVASAGATRKVRYGCRINSANSVNVDVRGGYCATGNYTSAAFFDNGTNTVVKDFRGYTVGAVVVAVPASGSPVAAISYDRYFYVTAAAGGSVSLAIGTSGPTVVVPASYMGTIFVPAQATLTPTYTSTPTWVVDGRAG